ncbi:MAG: leucine-rich repeat domain-containing protein, partial [Ruminococcus sp.]|nr:leucine-rich repeat domain-containing protein [Ruminococcus sp.]
MKKSLKSFISLVLTVLMLTSLFVSSTTVNAVEETSGTTGSCTWNYDAESQTLTVSGEGAMDEQNSYPWSNFTIKNIVIGDKVTKIFGFGGTSVQNITLGTNLAEIGNNAFMNCASIKDVTIPNKVQTIGENAFYGCTALKGITVPDSVTSIKFNAFAGCTVLKTAALGSSVKTIGNSAFADDTNLQTINFPAGLTSIGYYAFQNCSALTSAD